MKKYEIISSIIVLILLFSFIVYAITINLKYRDILPKTEYIYDTIYLKNNDELLLKLCDSLMIVNDSLMIVNDKYKENLEIASFKLERIKEYNTIAGKSNNIKYLRGWINRVLDKD